MQKKYMKFFSIILFFLINDYCSASQKDSLLFIFQNENNSIEQRSDAGNELIKYFRNYDTDSAIHIVQRLIDLQTKEDFKYLPNSYLTKASILLSQGNYPIALESAQIALEIAKLRSDSILFSETYSSIGSIYERQENFLKSLEYHNKALNIKLKYGTKKDIAYSFSNIGNIHGQLRKYDKSLKSYDRALLNLKGSNDSTRIAFINGNIGYVLMLVADSLKLENELTTDSIRKIYMKSLSYTNKSEKYFKYHNITHNLLNAQNNAALVHIRLNQIDIAKKLCQTTLETSKKLKIMPLYRDACFCMYEIAQKESNEKSALLYYQKYIGIRDSLLSKDEQREMLEKEVSYYYNQRSELKEQLHREALNHQKEEAKKDSFIRNTIIIAISTSLFFLVFFIIIIYNRLKIIREQNEVILKQKDSLKHQKEIVDLKNSEITDSIIYARRLQNAILPDKEVIKSKFTESFVLFKPKDIVSGDFYWLETREDKTFLAVADCTGHGVPGSMVSILCSNALNRAVREYEECSPDKILDKTRDLVLNEFKHSRENVKDGMDIAICAISNGKIEFAGANNPLWIIRKGSKEIEEIKADKQPVGQYDLAHSFTGHQLNLKSGDTFYIFSDGYTDQFGGEKGKKFKTSNLKKLLLSIQCENMDRQNEIIDDTFEKWKGSLEQLDDVCMIGIRI